jgi:hypothetical protein
MTETTPNSDKPDDPPYHGGEDETPREDQPPEPDTGEGLPLCVDSCRDKIIALPNDDVT